MRSALYYPHTEVRSEGLVRSALLTWDRLEYIVPWHAFRPAYRDRAIAEAMELIGVPRPPTQEERDQVHLQLEELLDRGVPETFRYDDGARRGAEYDIWRQKLMGRTWRLLREHGVVGELLGSSDFPASQSGGLTIMAMLADVMAGETRARVTDRGLAYATLANVANYGGIEPARSEDLAQVVPLTFKSLALDNVSLERLVAFRKREAGKSGHDYRALRHLYLDRLQAFVAEAAKHHPGSRDREELNRVFEAEMEDDLRDLKDELGLAKREALLSKETLAFVLAGSAVAATALVGAHVAVPEALTMAGAPATIGGILGVASTFGAKRREVLRKHPMAYLYQVAA